MTLIAMTKFRMTRSSMLSFLLLLLTSVLRTSAQIPRKCAVDSNVAAGRCCPVGADGSACNAASGRGECGSLESPDRYKDNFRERFPDITYDDRFQWPWRAFEQVIPGSPI